MERLQKVIAKAGLASRRKAEELIVEGKVQVNGILVTELGFKADPVNDEIVVNGRIIKPVEKEIVILFNKPAGVITSMKDPQGRKTVIEFLDTENRVFPVGRLDYETEGLLLFTNIGELANRLMHPSYLMDKKYEAIVKGTPSEESLDKLRRGVMLSDGLTSPAEVKRVGKINNDAIIHITIHEGRKRQVRRMFKYIYHPVIKLKRIQYAFLTLTGVKEGNYRVLTEEEICQLKSLVRLECN